MNPKKHIIRIKNLNKQIITIIGYPNQNNNNIIMATYHYKTKFIKGYIF